MQRDVGRATRLIGGVDPWLLLAFLALTGIGVLMVYSSSIAYAYQQYRSAYYIFQREIVWVILGLITMTIATRIHYRQWTRVSLPLLGLTILLLGLVLVPHIGHSSGGARRWFSLPMGAFIEPSELVKLALVIYLAAWLASKGEAMRDFKTGFVPFAAVVGLVAMLIVRQPDLGTTIVVSTSMFALLFFAGGDLMHMAMTVPGAVGVGWVLSHSSAYRLDRLLAFTDPWKDPNGAGYHTIQVLMALGRGGIIGQGLGNSIQKDFLPAPYTDSILAVIGEEFGLMGTLMVLFLFAVIAYRGIRIATNAPDSFSRLLAAGITMWITFQALMNFAVITSSVPFTGVPLPFISYGGSSLVITMTAMGILLNISRHSSGEALAREGSDNRGRNGRASLPRARRAAAPLPVVQPRSQTPSGGGRAATGPVRRVGRAET